MYNEQIFFTIRNSSCGKVMFSQECDKNSAHRGGGVCLWVWKWRGGLSATGSGRVSAYESREYPAGRHSPRQTSSLETATAADGTHPTGMHSCCELNYWL